jgi:polysaccharide biosynthesis protein PslH
LLRILQLSKKFPYPTHDGEAIAVHALLTALHDLGCELTLLVMSTPKHPADTAILPENYAHYQQIYTQKVDTDVKPFDALRNLFTPESYNISRFYDAAFAEKLITLLRCNDYDIVQLETLYLAPYTDIIRQHSRAKIVLRSHNIEYEIWQRMAENERFLPKKHYLKLLANRLKTFEIAKLNAYDLVVSITTRDQQHYIDLGLKAPSIVAPVGVELAVGSEQSAVGSLQSSVGSEQPSVGSEQFTPNPQSPIPNPQSLKIGFIGSLDWLPNIEGLEWFLNEIWGDMLMQNPNISLHIAGRNMPKYWQQHKHQNVEMIGEVPDAQAFIQQQDIMLIPLLSGGGMRIKAIEAMWLGKPVLTTSIGIEGIDGTHGTHFYIADTKADFAKAISFFQANPEEINTIGAAAQDFIRANFDKKAIAQRVLEAYQQIL